MTLTGDEISKNQQKTIEHTCNTIKSWLLEQRYSVTERQAPNEIWVLDAFEFGRGFGVGIGQPKRNLECVSIAITFSFAEYQQELDALPAMEREDFIRDLWALLLTSFDLEFRPQGSPLNGVMLITYVYQDELKRSVFWQKVRLIRRAFWATLWAFQHKFNRPLADPSRRNGGDRTLNELHRRTTGRDPKVARRRGDTR